MPRLRTQPRTFQIQNPAAGADWSFVPSQTDRAIIMSVNATFTTGVTAGSRMPGIQLTDQSGLVYCAYDLGRGQAASTAAQWNYAQGVAITPGAAVAAGQHAGGPLPDVWLDPNDSIGSITNGILPVDQWSNIVIRYYTGERWLELQRELQVQQYLES